MYKIKSYSTELKASFILYNWIPSLQTEGLITSVISTVLQTSNINLMLVPFLFLFYFLFFKCLAIICKIDL